MKPKHVVIFAIISAIMTTGCSILEDEPPGGIRAVIKEKPVDPAAVQRYLKGKFADHLDRSRQALAELAASLDPEVLAEKAYSLYEKFRPSIPAGKRGWGAVGPLDLEFIRSLKEQK